MIKICKIHGPSELTKRGRCKKCASEAVIRRRRLVKIQAVEYKGGRCAVCGYNKCIRALSFHHHDPTKKDFSISRKGYCYSWDKIKKELDKCILVCNNCHSELHSKIYEENNPELSKRLNNFRELSATEHYCKSCGKLLRKQNKLCYECYNSSRPTKISWPPTRELIEMVNKTSYLATGKKLGVSDNAIRKRIKNHPE